MKIIGHRVPGIIGYARVSTTGQKLDGQIEALRAAGAVVSYAEKVSGTRGDRPQLAKLLASLQPGDTVIVTKLDRLARSTRDLLNTLAVIAKAGASFKSLGNPWADTTTPQGRLLLTILGGLAEFERELIRERTGDGVKRAQANGVKFGRKHALSLHQRLEAMARLKAGEPMSVLAASYGVSIPTIWRLQPQTSERQTSSIRP